ncbi:NAD(P)/FAD-dependent oxidoreductase [Aliikangiella marina]|uniref:NAD(P)/FAD-dependent oxidoreductase n=1 Tax=Aliikangiella marina TaxID=1712262 RepID=A0A545TJ79_9GAMM|nr:NAD(P)/FAD-dependent oxidoreductase [Aliikangiella marina]TQV77263.1 NAD(P)/FAD-dependent oxidoreductase [Aliikangiella marina]
MSDSTEAKPAKVNPEQSSPKSKRAKKPSTIRIGTRYRSSRISEDYDAIIIGSGIGGLTTAASLSAEGWKVIVLEQHYTAGGFTHAYSREGYEWDVGVHYIGDVGYPTVTKKLFDFISNNNLKWAPMDDAYDRIFLGEESFDLVAGPKAFEKNLVTHFPEEKAAISRYLRMIRNVNKGMRWFSLSKLLSPFWQKIFFPLFKLLTPSYFNQNTYEVLRTITKNEKLIAVLTGQWGDSGVPPKQGSFLIHSLIARHYLNGGFYPIGGASKMAETIIPQIQKAGGEVFTYAQVKQILVEGEKVTGVLMADSHEIKAPLVISSAGVFNTYNKLLPQTVSHQLGYQDKLKTVKPSCANVGLFIGLKKTAEELQLPRTNFWIYLDQEHDKNIATFFKDSSTPLPVVYISFPSAKDPSFEERYPGRATIEIVAPASYEAFAQWKETTWGKRGDSYENLSDEFAERMLDALYKKLPHLKGQIDYYEVSTPLTTEFFCFYDKGEIYGLEHDPQRFKQAWLQPKTKIKGLWLTGQDILSCGVAGAMIAGFLTAVKILGIKKGFKLAKKVFSAN